MLHNRKQGKRKMGSGTIKSRRSKTTSAQSSDCTRQLDDWRNLLVQCAGKPTRKRIHVLRVATLRLQAQVQCWLDNLAFDHVAAHGAKRWSKEAKHIRRVLGSVRSYDVHLARLSQMRSILTADSGYQPRTSRIILRQLDDLETRFKLDRKSATKDLKTTLATRTEQFEDAAADLAAASELGPALLQSLTTDRLSAMLVDAASIFSNLHPDSLHDFRKRLKSVRYLAEFASANPDARQIATTVKSMQGVIGEWHDWEELSIYARDTFRRKDAPELIDELETLAQESLDKALAVCSTITEQILLSSSPARMPPKKPVRREELTTARKQLAFA
jgi:CHAD domain-containing protein